MFASHLQFSQRTLSHVFSAGFCFIFKENKAKISIQRKKSKEESGKTDLRFGAKRKKKKNGCNILSLNNLKATLQRSSHF